MKNPDIIRATEPVTNAFEKLGVPYYIGGSVASSAYGLPRSTMDVDIVSELTRKHVRPFVTKLEVMYYIDAKMILEAIEHNSSFNIIHLETMLKIDVFIPPNTSFAKETFNRRRKDTLDEEQKDSKFYLASPEDVILNKLIWYLRGGGASKQQLRDVMGILAIQGSIDSNYLKSWAQKLQVEEVLKKLFREAGIDL